MKKILLALLAGLLAFGGCSVESEPSDSPTLSKSVGGPAEKDDPSPEPAAEEPPAIDDAEIFRAAMEVVLAEIPEADRLDLCSIVEGPGGVELALAGLRSGFETEAAEVTFHEDVAEEVLLTWCETAPAEEDSTSEYGDFNGTGFTYDNGLSVSLDGLAQFEPSETAAYFEMPEYVQFTVTITNGTDAPYDPVEFYATLSSAGAEGDEVFDYDNGMNGAPQTSILPGASASFPVAYGVMDSGDLVFEATPSWDLDPSLFVGGL